MSGRWAPTDLADDALVSRAREGDTGSFEELLHRHGPELYRLAVRILGRREDAEDATQEAFLAAWRRLPEFRQDAAFRTWMYRIVVNRCLNLCRNLADSRQMQLASHEFADALPDSTVDAPDRRAESAALLTALRRALGDLPPKQRACWVLREVHDFEYDDVARILETTPDAVRGRIFRARRQLAEAMRAWL